MEVSAVIGATVGGAHLGTKGKGKRWISDPTSAFQNQKGCVLMMHLSVKCDA